MCYQGKQTNNNSNNNTKATPTSTTKTSTIIITTTSTSSPTTITTATQTTTTSTTYYHISNNINLLCLLTNLKKKFWDWCSPTKTQLNFFQTHTSFQNIFKFGKCGVFQRCHLSSFHLNKLSYNRTFDKLSWYFRLIRLFK